MPELPGKKLQRFESSETSSAEVSIYSHGNDPILLVSAGLIEMDGRGAGSLSPSLVSCTASKTLGSVTGTFSFIVKQPNSGPFSDLRQVIMDDDWVDIVFRRHGRRVHVMRGVIDGIRRTEAIAGSGATSLMFEVFGRDWGKIFETTPIWFNRYASEKFVGAGHLVPRFVNTSGRGTVEETVDILLFGLLREQAGWGRAVWELPPNMPNVSPGTTFVDEVFYDASAFTNDPVRNAANAWMLDPHGSNIWDLALHWSDRPFCELFTDLRDVNGETPQENDDFLPEDSTMTVILRDTPFPTEEERFGIEGSDWFDLPQYTIERSSIVNNATGKSGDERKNAFLLSPQIFQERAGQQVQLMDVLWDRDDILRHGLRKMDVTSQYTVIGAEEDSVLTMSESQRGRMRDWFCLNPYFYSGQLILSHGRPDIRIGTKIRVPGQRGPAEDETYYCESWTHTWSLVPGVRSTFGVTRGWVGTDESFIESLQSRRRNFALSIAAKADQEEGTSVEEAAALSRLRSVD